MSGVSIRRILMACAASVAATLGMGKDAGSSLSSDRVRLAPPVSRSQPATLAAPLSDVARAQRDSGRGIERAREIGLEVEGQRLRVVVEERGGRSGAATVVTGAGGDVEATYEGLLQALVPPAALEAIARASPVSYVRPPHGVFPTATLGEEVAGSKADAFQAAKWTGAGVKVAVIDTGFAGLAARQSAGDLPAGVAAVDFCGGGFGTTSNHGTAVAEVVHELAPEAQLHLICITNEVSLGQAKDYAKANGISIVNMSLTFAYTARGDGTGAPGTPDGIVADARANGILWVVSAGNWAQQHWGGAFNSGSFDPNWHDWVTGDETNSIVIQAGQVACVFLKWDSWPVSNQDFNLHLLNAAGTTIVAQSTNMQNGSQRPTEDMCYTNPGATSTFHVVVSRLSATTAPRLDMIAVFQTLEHVVGAGSLIEPASSPNAMTAGALCWADGSLRAYSSRGPTIDGRVKPDIVGLDGVSTGTYGPSSPCTSGFNGTSASAPHVAGLAALGKQQNPSLTPAQLQTWLEARALDVSTPGKDNATGSGRTYVHTFTDTPAWTGLQPEVELLFKKGTTGGCAALEPETGSRLYCPELAVTRDQMAVFIIRSLGLTPLFPGTPTFQDVPAGYWALGEIERLFQQGITGGCAGGPPPATTFFCPTDPVRRDQMAAFLIRARGLTQLNPAVATFSDVPTGYWAFGSIERLVEQAITQGCATGPPRLFCPADSVTRRQMAAFLIRAFGPPA